MFCREFIIYYSTPPVVLWFGSCGLHYPYGGVIKGISLLIIVFITVHSRFQGLHRFMAL